MEQPSVVTAGPSSAEARNVAAALVASTPSGGADGGPALAPRTSADLTPATVATSMSTSAVADTAPRPQQPEALQPQAPQRRKPPKVAPSQPTRTPRKGDLICGECGEANAPARKFCSRCGTSLVHATVVKIRWWKRIFRRRPKHLMAGERPWQSGSGKKKKKRRNRQGLARVIAPARRVISIALVVLGLIYGVYAPFRHWVNDKYTSGKDKVLSIVRPEYDLVTAGPGTTSNEGTPVDAEHPALLATDLFKNTFWVSPPPSADFRPELDIGLTERVDLAKIIVHNGAAGDFQKFHRPKTLLFIFDNGNTFEAELKNTPDPQTITIKGGGDVQRFKIAVIDVYESIDGITMALTEIEFFKKR